MILRFIVSAALRKGRLFKVELICLIAPILTPLNLGDTILG